MSDQSPDNSRLLEDVIAWRAELARAALDPTHPWHHHPDKVAEQQQYLTALLIRAGAPEPQPPTPEEIADRTMRAPYEVPIGENLGADLKAELDRIGGLPVSERHRLADELRQEYGGEEGYQRVLSEARDGLKPGESLTDAMKISRHFLAVMAAYGRANRAYQRERAASRLSR